MSYDILSHLLGTNRAAAIEGTAAKLPDVVQGVTGPTAQLLRRTSVATADAADSVDAAGASFAPPAPGIGDTLKAHPLLVAGAAAAALYLFVSRR